MILLVQLVILSFNQVDAGDNDDNGDHSLGIVLVIKRISSAASSVRYRAGMIYQNNIRENSFHKTLIPKR